MIRDRPPSLAGTPSYTALPNGPLRIDRSGLPDILNLDLETLSGIQPITAAMAGAADGVLRDDPSPSEIALYRERETAFQLVSVVYNLFDFREIDDEIVGRPYAISLVPASRRGVVHTVPIDWIANMRMEPSPFEGKAYLDFDPFTGEWSLFGDGTVLRDSGAFRGKHPDEIGFVSGGYMLAPVIEDDPPLLPGTNLQGERANARYAKFRAKSFYRPFATDRPRRIWGLDSPIELFLAQGLANIGLYPENQTLFLRDGDTFASYYHMLDDPALRTRLNAITTADFYFPQERLVVFCDSGQFHRRRAQREKDAAITAALESFGYRVLRIDGPQIVQDLPAAVGRVSDALGA
ncbi:endonuclease domain-containing protein [Brevundimonas sp.]|uniref:endonuclease domain-containing protein n=1 Tax=Brevundimonas sp. TaxID=1871086 RepID=UPI002ABA7C92|nr:DUF559 domain-containing protein [Brevundimonas sp.]MDZ4363505.1 DUF559 domain-containing protein [Brevundimonas sp.]